jgi:hypothetical protein
MLEKLMALFLIIFFLIGFRQVLPYIYLVWFRSKELVQPLNEGRRGSEEQIRLSSFIRGSSWRLVMLRVSTLIIFLISLLVFFILLWLLLITIRSY